MLKKRPFDLSTASLWHRRTCQTGLLGSKDKSPQTKTSAVGTSKTKNCQRKCILVIFLFVVFFFSGILYNLKHHVFPNPRSRGKSLSPAQLPRPRHLKPSKREGGCFVFDLKRTKSKNLHIQQNPSSKEEPRGLEASLLTCSPWFFFAAPADELSLLFGLHASGESEGAAEWPGAAETPGRAEGDPREGWNIGFLVFHSVLKGGWQPGAVCGSF